MRRNLVVLLLLTLAVGCESRKEANRQARDAYLAGQQQGLKNWQSQAPPEVMVQGSVRNPVVAWTDDLTLSRAIVAADYTGFMNPVTVRVVRQGRIVVDMRGIDLLHGQDAPLQAGDVVVLN